MDVNGVVIGEAEYVEKIFIYIALALNLLIEIDLKQVCESSNNLLRSNRHKRSSRGIGQSIKQAVAVPGIIQFNSIR